MNPNPTSAGSEFSKTTRIERSNKPSLLALPGNLILRARLWLGKLVSFPIISSLMILAAGFAAGATWQSYGGAARTAIASWSPHLGWLAPSTASVSSERIRAMSLALAAARQNLDKVATEISRLPAQDGDTSRRSGHR